MLILSIKEYSHRNKKLVKSTVTIRVLSNFDLLDPGR